ncbi:hypothetical protein ACHAWF_014361 [Thalassiosira exigua]
MHIPFFLLIALSASTSRSRPPLATAISDKSLQQVGHRGGPSVSFRSVEATGSSMSGHQGVSDGQTAKRKPQTMDDDGEPGAKRIRELIRTESRGYDIDSPSNQQKRSDYLSWDDYFLAVAYLSAQRSKDPHPSKNSRNGACIVDAMGRIVGIGYDGFPRGCSDDCLPWASSSPSNSENDSETKEGLGFLHTKNPYLCHAEINAILNKCSSDVEGGRMFVPNFPSNECAKFIIQSGIKEVIYVQDEYEDSDSSRASRILFEVSGVKMTKMKPSAGPLKITFGPPSKNLTERNATQDEDEMAKNLGLLQREDESLNPFRFKVKKRADYLSWDEYFMGVAFLSAKRSKDPSTQVGACIVDANKCIIGIGYNGFPRGCSDSILPWARSGSCDLHKKYPYVVHAEVNAILNKCSSSVTGATIYVALFPCNECSKVIIQSGIREVVYLDDKYHDTDATKASRIMFKMAGVKLTKFKPTVHEIVIDF